MVNQLINKNIPKSCLFIDRFRFVVPLLLLIAVCMSAIMASNSKWNTHPDEHVHYEAAVYYKNNTLPPEPCQADTLKSYSVYGYSRLNHDDLGYFFIGKFMSVVDLTAVDNIVEARFFNVVLLLLIALMASTHARASILALPWLITPQIWYLHSYVNSEAFGLFLIYVAMYQLFVPSTLLRKYFSEASLATINWRCTVPVTILAGLLLVKQTFYFADAYLFGIFILALIFGKLNIRKTYKKILWVLALASLLFFSLKVVHQSVAGYQLSEKIQACHLETAKGAYINTTPLEKTPPMMYLKEKDYPLSYVFEQQWVEGMWKSMVGHYGYVEFAASDVYYNVMLMLFLLLLCTITYGYIKKPSWHDGLLILGAVATFSLNVATVIWFSWTLDFQSQGRYLFTLFPILGFLILHRIKYIPIRFISIIILLIFLLGLIQFITIGLLNLVKY